MHAILLKKRLNEIKIVINGAGASAMACAKLFINSGVVKKSNIKCLIQKELFIKKR